MKQVPKINCLCFTHFYSTFSDMKWQFEEYQPLWQIVSGAFFFLWLVWESLRLSEDKNSSTSLNYCVYREEYHSPRHWCPSASWPFVELRPYPERKNKLKNPYFCHRVFLKLDSDRPATSLLFHSTGHLGFLNHQVLISKSPNFSKATK